MRRSVVQVIAPLLATIAIVALLGCEEPPLPGSSGPPGPVGEPVEQPEEPQPPQEPPDPPEEPEQPPDTPQQPEEQPESPQSTGARVSVSSTPSGAYITINDDNDNARRRAAAAAPITTPATLDLPRGDYTFTITKPGIGTVVVTVTVSANVDVTIHVSLGPSTVEDRMPEFEPFPEISYWHTTHFDRSVYLIEEHPYYPTRNDENDERILQGVAATAGDPPYTYALTSLPDGMVFDPDTRILHGTPAVGTSLMWEGTYSATDADGDTIENEFLFVVLPDSDPYFDSTVENQTYQKEVEIAPLQLPEVKWTDITIPENTTDRSITFQGKSDGTLPGTWGNQWSRGYQTIPGAPNGLHVDLLYVHNLQPVQSGSVTEPTAYFIVGTPWEVGTFPIAYTITDSSGDTASVEFTITVEDPQQPQEPEQPLPEGPAEPTVEDRMPEFEPWPRISYWHTTHFDRRIDLIEEHQYYPARNDEKGWRILQGLAATAGDPPYSYAMTGLPDGMVFDPDTRILHGTPTVGTSLIWEGTYSATDADGDTIENELLFVVLPDSDPYFDSIVENQTYQKGGEIAPLQLPEVKWTDITIPENTTDRSITFQGKSDGTLPGNRGNQWSRGYQTIPGAPDGLHVDLLYVHNLQPVQSGSVTEPAAYFIVGTPWEVGTFPITYTITDSSGDTASVEFTITVEDPHGHL